MDWVPDVVFVLGQLGLGAAGNGVWVALTEIWRRATGRRGEPAPSTRLTVVIPSEHGETRVESVIVGSADAEATVRAVQQIVQSLVGDGGDTGDTGDSGPAG